MVQNIKAFASIEAINTSLSLYLQDSTKVDHYNRDAHWAILNSMHSILKTNQSNYTLLLQEESWLSSMISDLHTFDEKIQVLCNL
jgi:hypothetical protein